MLIDSSQKAFEILAPKISQNQEEFWIFSLNSQLRLIDLSLVFRGTVDCCPIHNREILSILCLAKASHFIVAHNHPTGSKEPSYADILATRRIIKLSKIVQIPIIDHLILAGGHYFSMAEHGVLKRGRHFSKPSL